MSDTGRQSSMTLSVVMAVYNESATIETIVGRVMDQALVHQLIVVDDGSSDGTREKLERLASAHERMEVYYQDRNQGKGAALRRGFEAVTGEVIIIQDADLEYDPGEYERVIGPIVDGHADVVYGSRFLGGPHRVLLFWHRVGNWVITMVCNMVCNVNLTDMETCYKAFRREVLDGLNLKSDRFGFEPEFTVKVAKRKWRIYETPISYYGRGYAEGKKVTWKDGLAALWYVIRFRLFD